MRFDSAQNKWSRRDRKAWKRKHGMRVDNGNVKRLQAEREAKRKGVDK
jgi:hypothetical protein